jgi:hypothetical protein
MLSSLISLALALPALAATTIPYPKLTSCAVKPNTLVMPPGAVAALGTPPAVPAYVGLALGVQNYTCNATDSTWVNVGVISILLDVSCLVEDQDGLANLQEEAWTEWNGAPKSLTVPKLIEQLRARPADTKYPIVLGPHDFTVNPITGVGINPRFDFSEFTGIPNDIFIGVHITTYQDGNPDDVLWLHVVHVQGPLFNQLWRTRTMGGMPPTSCKPGAEDISVRYSATYWMYPN